MSNAQFQQVLIANDDRESVLRDICIAIMRQNERTRSLFLMDGGALVMIHDDSIQQIRKPEQLAGWCFNNGVRFYKFDANNQKVWRLCPPDAAKVIIGTPSIWAQGAPLFKMPRQRSLTRLPFAHPDGTFIDKVGYDEQTGVFCTDTSATILLDDSAPCTQDRARNAATYLLTEVLCDFPFVSSADRANALGLMLTALTRYIHNRPTPLFGITAPDPGTGKGLLITALSLILQGEPPSLQVLPDRQSELNKTITSILMSSNNPMVVWDNVKTGSKVSSPTLCKLHTDELWNDRLLGGNTFASLSNDRVWVATGNNIGPGEDMVRRWVQIGLNAGTPHPEERTGFRHKNLKKWVTENRVTCLQALMVMIRAWQQAGCPQPHDNTLVVGDYQPILNVVGGILDYAGVPGFMGNITETREQAYAGSEEEATEEFLHWMWSALPAAGFNPAKFSASQVRETISEIDGVFATNAALTTVPLPERVARNLNGGTTAVSSTLAQWFNEIAGRKFGSEQFMVQRVVGQKVNRGQAYTLTVARPGVSVHPLVEKRLSTLHRL